MLVQDWYSRGQLCIRPWRFLWWTSPCSSATSSSSQEFELKVPLIQFIPVVLQRRVLAVQTVQKTAEIPQVRVQFLVVVDMPVVVQRQAPVAVSAAKLWSSQLQSSDRWSMSLLSRSSRRCDELWWRWERRHRGVFSWGRSSSHR